MTLRRTSCVVAVAATGPENLRTQTYGGGCSSLGSGAPRAVGASRDDLVEPPTGRSAAGVGPGRRRTRRSAFGAEGWFPADLRTAASAGAALATRHIFRDTPRKPLDE